MKRNTDPSQIPVQINTRIPFWLRETLAEAALSRKMSQTELLIKALEVELRPEIMRSRRPEKIETYTVDV